MSKIVIVAAKRTAIGSFLGSISKVSASDLGAVVIKELLFQTKVKPEDISEVIMGQVLTAGVGQNPARQAAIKSGIPVEVPALTINQVCGSGLKAIQLAAAAIHNGDADIVIAGGQENMSSAPHLLHGMREGIKFGNNQLIDSMIHDGLSDIYNNYHMGVTAENVAMKYNVSRNDQDEFALNSQLKAGQASSCGKFADEIVPVLIPQKKGDPIIFGKDEFIRDNSSLEALSKLRPAFKNDGTVTAGNSSGINDGAAAVMLMSEEKAASLGLIPMAYIESYASIGLDPAYMGIGPVEAIRKSLSKLDLNINDVDLFEVNEAFAAQAVAVNRELGIDASKVNVNGGAIALGHPIGASGCRILVTLLHEMKKRNARRGVAALCIGGGMGTALVVSLPVF